MLVQFVHLQHGDECGKVVIFVRSVYDRLGGYLSLVVIVDGNFVEGVLIEFCGSEEKD